MRVRTQQHDTADLLCWRHLGHTAQVTEQVLAMNPGLAAHGPLLPAGLVVTLPDEAAPQVVEPLSLWN